MNGHPWTIRRLRSIDDARIASLSAVLLDCIEGGASVGFMASATRERADRFWQRIADDVATGARAILVAEDALGLCGTVQLVLDMPDNQPHRADLCKMLVHRRARRRGLGAALMREAETRARMREITPRARHRDRQRRRSALRPSGLVARGRHPPLRADARRRAVQHNLLLQIRRHRHTRAAVTRFPRVSPTASSEPQCSLHAARCEQRSAGCTVPPRIHNATTDSQRNGSAPTHFVGDWGRSRHCLSCGGGRKPDGRESG